MINFLKKRVGLASILLSFWAVSFLLVPFYHYHPGSAHTHTGELDWHEHAGHLHSHELENIAHAINLHPSDPLLDEKHHQSHSSPEHDSDQTQFDTNKTRITSAKLNCIAKQCDVVAALKIPQPALSFSFPDAAFHIKLPDIPSLFLERSPPSFPI